MTEIPWTSRSEWLGGMASSRGSELLFAHWLGAIAWNGMGVAFAVAVQREGWSDIQLLLRVLFVAFIALGVLILWRALVHTARISRLRNLRLELDPFPGSIGGQVGGTVDLPVRPGAGLDARTTLHCIHSYMSGSGEDRRRREDVVWSGEVVPLEERSGTGVRLRFAFDVPEAELPESEHSDDYDEEDHHYWSVHIAAELPGADLDQTFRVPVYRVDPPLSASRPFESPAPRSLDPDDRGIDIERTANGLRFTYGRTRYGGMGYGLLAFGLVATSSGFFVFTQTGGMGGAFGAIGLVFGGIFLVTFGFVGLLCILFGLYMMLSRVTVEVGDGLVRSTQSYVVFRSNREARIDEIDRIEAKVTTQSGQGSAARTSYTIHAFLRNGNRITLGDGIRGAYLLDRIRSHLEELTGIGVEVALRRKRRSDSAGKTGR